MQIKLKLFCQLGKVSGVEADRVLGDAIHVDPVAAMNRLQNT